MKIVRNEKSICFDEVDFIWDSWKLTLVKEYHWSDWKVMVAAYAPPAIGVFCFNKSFKTLEEAADWVFLESL